jgi:hypothetical protein
MVACQSELLRFSSRVATLKSVVTVASVYLRLLQNTSRNCGGTFPKIAIFFIVFLVVVAQSDGNLSGAYMHSDMRDAPT